MFDAQRAGGRCRQMGAGESRLSADDASWIDALLDATADATQLTRLERALSARDQRELATQQLAARSDRAALPSRLPQLDARRSARFSCRCCCASTKTSC